MLYLLPAPAPRVAPSRTCARGTCYFPVFSGRATASVCSIAWRAPKAVLSDMGGLQLMELYFDMQTGGKLKPRILLPINPGANPLQVSDAEKQAEVQRFLGG